MKDIYQHLRFFTALFLAGVIVSAVGAQAPATTPFASWTAALTRASILGGENARVALIGDSNMDAPRAFYLPLRKAFEAQGPAQPGTQIGGAGLATLRGFQINDLEVFFNGTKGKGGKESLAWAELENERGFSDPTHVSTAVGDELMVQGTMAPSLFDRATVYLDRVPGGGTAVVEFRDAADVVLYSEVVDLGGVTVPELVTVSYSYPAFTNRNKVAVRTLDPRTDGVHVLGFVTDRQPNNSVQVHKLAFSGDNAERWADRFAATAVTPFYASMDLAVINLGTNDMRRGDDDAYERFETGIKDMLTYFQTLGVPVVLVSPADMADDVSNFGLARAFDETSMRITLERLAGQFGAAYYDLGKLHGDYEQITNYDGNNNSLYRDALHYRAFSLDDEAAKRHGPFLFNAIMGQPTTDRSANNTADPTPTTIAPVKECGPTVIRIVDGSGTPATVNFRAPAPDFQLLAAIRNDVNLGEVRVKAYANSDAEPNSATNAPYSTRQVTIIPENALSATILLPVTDGELARFEAPVTSASDLNWHSIAGITSCTDFYNDNGVGHPQTAIETVPNGDFIQFSATGAAEYYLLAVPTAALPVELVSFTAFAKTSHNALDWTTATELDFAYFGVERSVDGTTWQEITQVAAKATSGGGATYSSSDASPLQTSYYRLAMHDLDGSLEYSDVIVVAQAASQGESGFKLSPNPSYDRVTLRYAAASSEPRDVVVTDARGAVMLRHQSTARRTTLDVSGLPVGMYTVTSTSTAGVSMEQLVVR